MADNDQERPLAVVEEENPGGSDRGEEVAVNHGKTRRRRCILKCCGCITAFLIILVVVIVILIFTVFRVREPTIKIDGITITRLDLGIGPVPEPRVNMSMVVDLSVKNPNYASFKYRNMTVAIYYHGVLAGEARVPPGRARARRTMTMNTTVDVLADRLASSSYLIADVRSGAIPIGSYSRIAGRVRVIGIISKYVTVKLNCSMTVDISSRDIQGLSCKRRVDLNI